MIARVVPDIPSFAVDDGFKYLIPADLTVEVGSMVRIPLGGRKVRGFVVGLEDGPEENLKAIRARSGDCPVFHSRLLETLRWSSRRYVAPLATILRRTTPPNLPRRLKRPPSAVAPTQPTASPAGDLGRRVASGGIRNTYLQSSSNEDLIALVGPVLEAGGSVLMVAPTAVETELLSRRLAQMFGANVLTVTPDTADRDVTTIWSKAASHAGYLVVGTPRIALWPVAGLRLAVVVGEARRAMKDRQTPTVHAREVLKARSGVERFAMVLTGLVPSTEAVAAGTEVVRAIGGRPWSLIEMVNRSEDPPGSSPLSDRTKTAIAGAAKRGDPVFVFTHRRGYAPAFRCVKCRDLRVCSQCGARAGREGPCRRCGAEQGACGGCGGDRFEPLGAGVERVVELVRRFVDADKVGLVGEGRIVTVGSVRDLPSVGDCVLSVVVDADGLILGTDYRAGEESLRSLARVAALVGSGRGRRTIIQTSNPSHPVLEALQRGDPMPFLAAELEQRAAFGFPPAGDLIVVECRTGPGNADATLRERLPGVSVLGPAAIENGLRWLIQGKDLTAARTSLRKVAGEWRDGGAVLRIDVDPLDL
ncbi:MAG: hypothetical protein OEX97_02930 [Acidimicrobiia bacterium]|nr:hypothetical protein [Acidimicrobiia bacterium]